mgnify:CR=1 FL=1
MIRKVRILSGIKKTMTAFGCLALIVSAVTVTIDSSLSQYLGITAALALLAEKAIPSPRPTMMVRHVLHLFDLRDGSEIIKG